MCVCVRVCVYSYVPVSRLLLPSAFGPGRTSIFCDRSKAQIRSCELRPLDQERDGSSHEPGHLKAFTHTLTSHSHHSHPSCISHLLFSPVGSLLPFSISSCHIWSEQQQQPLAGSLPSLFVHPSLHPSLIPAPPWHGSLSLVLSSQTHGFNFGLPAPLSPAILCLLFVFSFTLDIYCTSVRAGRGIPHMWLSLRFLLSFYLLKGCFFFFPYSC